VLACIDEEGYRPDVEIDLRDALHRLRAAAAGADDSSHFTPSPPHSPIRPTTAPEFEARIYELLADLPASLSTRIEEPPAPDSDRSEEVWSLVHALQSRGLSRDEIIGIFHRFPDGPALSKYGDRLEIEIDRILGKVRPQNQGRTTIAEHAVWDAGDDFDLPPPREWLLADVFCRRFLSSLVASGGRGKTALRLLQALSVATGRRLAGVPVLKRGKVLFVSLEDGLDELRRRVRAATMHHNISASELKGWFYEATPIGMKLVKDKKTRGELDAWLREQIEKYRIDLVCIDPLVKIHDFDENDNAALDFVCTLLTKIAHDLNCAVDVLHHEGKANSGQAGDANRGRGATAIKDAARLSYTLTQMSDHERERFGLSAEEQHSLIREDIAKANIIRGTANARWFKLVPVRIGNGTPEYPNGDEVQTVEPWVPPNIWSEVTDERSNAILDDIDRGLDHGSRYSSDSRAKSRAVWPVFQKHIPNCTEERAKSLARAWLTSGVLRIAAYRDHGRREELKGLLVDPDKRPGITSAEGLKNLEI
jgi:hypothetical protein